MSKRQVIMLFGVWIALFLFLGFPSSWNRILAVITGLIVLLIAYYMAPRVKTLSYDDKDNLSKNTEQSRDVPFIEHKS